MSDRVAWGIIGAGTIAKAFTHGVKASGLGEIVAVANRSVEKAQAFVQEMELADASTYGDFDALLSDDKVQAVYIATPHPMHAQWAIRAAEAGKHVFCEKPAGMNHGQVMAMTEAARVNGTFFMEAFKDRCHPQTAKLLELITSGAIGQVRMIRSAFGFGGGDSINPESRLFDPALGGGGILDVGCYAVEMVRLLAGAVDGKPFADPVEVTAAGQLGETGVDEWTAATLKFANGIVAQVSTAVRANLDNSLHISGSAGSILVPDPWLNSRDSAQVGKIILRANGKDEQVIEVPTERSGFGYEGEVAAKAILAGKTEAEQMTWADSLGQASTLDRWREAIKLVYPMEEPAGFPMPLSGRPLTRVENAKMTYGRVPGLDRDISKFLMGCDNQRTFAHAAVMFDHWFECGGNAFDTAYNYGGGIMERLLGQWQQSRGVRDQINILSKGAHTPHCFPEVVNKQLIESLDRLQTDHVELYILHRDNLDVPVGEFVDVLNEHVAAGRIGVFGGSNWTTARFQEANDYAKANGKQPFSVLSNNFSLARMVNPVWGGCVAASEPSDRQFLIDNQVANFAWSSQARGFFVSPTGEGNDVWKVGDAWDHPENRKRRDRAFELAKKYDCTAINIAAAYVLCQPFPSFALIGPRFLHETTTSLPALGIQLSEQEMAYLDLRD